VLVGADGHYPFDTGAYLLGGFEGLARYYGSFVMVPGEVAHSAVSSAPPVVEAAPIVFAPAGSPRGRFFHRR
jgi:hypothetical protein